MSEYESFVIDSDAKAEWAMGKIAEARQECTKWVEWYTKRIEEIKAQTDFDTANLERLLEEYFATVPHKVTKTQESYKLPAGKLVRKTQNPEFRRDDSAVIAWARENAPEYIKTVEQLDWASLKGNTGVFDGHIVTDDGEIVPGVEVIEREPRFVVEVQNG